MTVLCLGALLAGLLAAALIPFLPFACVVLAAIILGSAWAGMGGGAFRPTALSAVMLLFFCQVGYGAGIVLSAIVGQYAGHRRARRQRVTGAEPAVPSARRLRTGSERS